MVILNFLWEGKGGLNFGHLKFPLKGGGWGSEFWSSKISLEGGWVEGGRVRQFQVRT